MAFVKYTDISNDNNLSYRSIVPEFPVYSDKLSRVNVKNEPSLRDKFKYFTDAYTNARYMNGMLYMVGFITSAFELSAGVMATRLVMKYDGDMLPYGADLYNNAKIIMTILLITGMVGMTCFTLALSRGIVWVFAFAQGVITIAPVAIVIVNSMLYYNLDNNKIIAWNNVDTQFISIIRIVIGPAAVSVGSMIVLGVMAIILAYVRARKLY